MHVKEKVSKASEKHAQVGVGFASKKNSYLGPHTLPSQVFHFVLTSSSLAILSEHSTIN